MITVSNSDFELAIKLIESEIGYKFSDLKNKERYFLAGQSLASAILYIKKIVPFFCVNDVDLFLFDEGTFAKRKKSYGISRKSYYISKSQSKTKVDMDEEKDNLFSNYNPERIEEKWLDTIISENNIDGTDFYSIAIPPPNVTGNLHLGHALNSTIQDVLIKYNSLIGLNVRWTPGTDHAGIATQLLVEKALNNEGVDSSKLSNDQLIEKIWDWKQKNGNKILEQLKKLGLSCNWSKVKFTLDDDMTYAVNTAFITLYNKGLIYKEKTLINWDSKLKTAISDLEVISEEKKGKLYSFKYQLVDSDDNIITYAFANAVKGVKTES